MAQQQFAMFSQFPIISKSGQSSRMLYTYMKLSKDTHKIESVLGVYSCEPHGLFEGEEGVKKDVKLR